MLKPALCYIPILEYNAVYMNINAFHNFLDSESRTRPLNLPYNHKEKYEENQVQNAKVSLKYNI